MVASMPKIRRNVGAGRRGPASARGVFGLPAVLFQTSSSAKSTARKRSVVLPDHALARPYVPACNASWALAALIIGRCPFSASKFLKSLGNLLKIGFVLHVRNY
jgi:hypothetical protein